MATTATTPQDTFRDLCKELGKRINSTENALLCYRAYQAYLRENPNTGHGKGRKLNRDASCPAFRKKAAELSGVAPATIDALLQVGKAVQPLPANIKKTLASSALSNWTGALRKLATKDFDTKRAEMITTFAKEEKADIQSAKKNLKKKLGMVPTRREHVEARMVIRPESHYFLPGEHLDVKVGRTLFRVEVGEIASGRIHLTAMAAVGERKEAEAFLKSKATITSDASTKLLKPADVTEVAQAAE